MSQSLAETKKAVLQLLADFRAWHTAYGGTGGIINLQELGEHGPAGLITEGMAFDKGDRKLLQESYEYLRRELYYEQRNHSGDWIALIEPYLADPADHTIVERWRRRANEQDERSYQRDSALYSVYLSYLERDVSKPNSILRAAKVLSYTEEDAREVVFLREGSGRGSIPAIRMIARHDAVVDRMARRIHEKNIDLYAVYSRRMSSSEEKKTEQQNAEIYAVYQRLRNSGLRGTEAIKQTAEDFRVSQDAVERIIEFRADIKPERCVVEECDGKVFSQHLCQRHYRQQRRKQGKKG